MGSFSHHQVALFRTHVVGQLRQPQDRVVQRVGPGVAGIDVLDAVHVERDVHVHPAGLFVGEAVGVLSVGVHLDELVAVVEVCSLQHHLVVGRGHVEVDHELLQVLRITRTHLETDGQLVAAADFFEETVFPVGREKHVVGLDNRQKR